MKVYKYRGVESDIFQRDLNTFQNNQFFASKFEMLNDPFEANFNEIISTTLDLLKNIFSVDAEKVKRHLKELLDLKQKIGILSLSKNCYSEQMWAYYASSNRGYCIEYDFEKLKDNTQNFDYSSELEIQYSDTIPTLSIDDMKSNLMLSKMYGTKKKGWIHEDEIRLIFDNSSLKNHHESAITGIYFGYQSSDDSIESFKEIFKNRNVKFYRIYPDKQKNNLNSTLFYETTKQNKFDLKKFNFEVLEYQNNSVVENYYIYLKDILTEDELKEFVLAFREEKCYKPSNINIFNTSDISNLIGIYPLKGKDYIQYADAFIALADFSCEDFLFMYPYKDFRYKEVKAELENK